MKIIKTAMDFILYFWVGVFLSAWTIYGIEMAIAYRKYLPWH
jgi:hypothetical protein